jgi:CRISPR-associated protein Cst2
MIQSMSISGLLTLNLHSLNNEGTEGNMQMTRTVQIVDAKGDVHSVNAISGDMFKHAQAEYFRAIAVEAGLTLCEPSRKGDPNRVNDEPAFKALLDQNQGAQRLPGARVVDEILQRCALTDCEGTLVVQSGYSVPRKSCIEFGWVVGRPESTRTDSYLHVKYDPQNRGKSTGEDDNSGQALFHRPASSGEYAVTVHVEFHRVGRNDISQTTIDETERTRRMRALAQSVAYTFVQPRGAQRNTQSPHVGAFQGILATSTSSVPAPAISALDVDYKKRITAIKEQLDILAPGKVTLHDFADMAGFVGHVNTVAASFGA